MYAFEYQKASTLDEAGTALAADPAAKILAGGMSLLPAMKHRLAAPSRLVDIAGLDSLRGITLVAAGTAQARLRVGAAMRHHEVAESAQVRQTLPALAELAGKIGDPQIRARGTLGGSVANNDPAADYPAAVLGLNAVVITTQREIAGDDFFQGMFTTALREDEIIVAIEFAVPRRAAYAKFAQMATGFAMTGVMLAEFSDGVRVAVTGAGASVFRWTEAEKALANSFTEATLQGLSCPSEDLLSDIHAPAQYRAHLVSVMLRQALNHLTASKA